jgi:hypothetical protein
LGISANLSLELEMPTDHIRRRLSWLIVAAVIFLVGAAAIVDFISASHRAIAPPSDLALLTKDRSPVAIALNIIRMQACEVTWNEHIDQANASGADVTAAYVPTSNPRGSPTGYPYVIGNITGTKYVFSSNTTADADVCGWYFIPDGGSNALAKQAAGFQASAITNALNGGFATAAGDITNLISLTGAGQPAAPTAPQSFNTDVKDAVAAYQADLKDKSVANVSESAPVTSPPVLELPPKKPDNGMWLNLLDTLLGGNTDDSWKNYRRVVEDMRAFEVYVQAAKAENKL